MKELTNKIITFLVKKMQENGYDLGKTKLQKLVYFMQESGIQMGLRYEIYHYGPYCFDLASSIDTLDATGVLKVTPDTTGYGYDIVTGPFAETKNLRPEIERYGLDIDNIIGKLGNCSSTDLEAMATIHFVNKILRERNKETMETEVLKITRQLKPKFSDADLSIHLNKLRKMDLLTSRSS